MQTWWGDFELWHEGALRSILSPCSCVWQLVLRPATSAGQPPIPEHLQISSCGNSWSFKITCPSHNKGKESLAVYYRIGNHVKERFVLGNTRSLTPRCKLKLSSHLSCISTPNTSPSLPRNHPLLPLDLPNSCEAAFLNLNTENNTPD